MSDKAFLDTNVLVYAYDRSDPIRQRRAQELLEAGIADGETYLSAQVLGEFFVVVTQKIKSPMSTDEAYAVVQLLSRLPVVEIDAGLVARAIENRREFGISYWDGLIVAAAERSGCTHILSEDFTHGRSYRNIQAMNPFATS